MNHPLKLSLLLTAASLAVLAACNTGPSTASTPAPDLSKPLSVLNTGKFMGTGGTDYVYVDSVGRRVWVPRGNTILAFDLDTLTAVGNITGSGHGVAVDPKYHTGFCSGNPVTMFDTQALTITKTIRLDGSPDGILFEPFTDTIYILSHSAPNVTVLDAKDGTILGTIDLGGAPEQGQSDGKGHVYIDVESTDQIAVVDAVARTCTAHYDLGVKGAQPAGMGLDAKNHIIFAMCHNPSSCIILSADDGKILSTLPISSGTDGGGFLPGTMEAFSAGRTGQLTVIKENSPTSFAVEANVPTMSGAGTCFPDFKLNHIIVMAREPGAPPAAPAAGSTPAAPAPAAGPAGTTPPAGRGTRGTGRGGNNGPANLDILIVGH